MKYYIKTFGCQMNYADSERISTQLEKYGFLPTSSLEIANLVVVNSCSVRQTAEDRVFSYIHDIWKNHSKTKIILTGCLANRKDVQRRLANKVNFFFQTKDIKKLLEFLNEEFPNRKSPASTQRSKQNTNKIQSASQRTKFKILTQKNISDKENIAYLSIKPKYTNKFQAFVPVMTGCNNFCAYCVVPYARGREISRPALEIIQEVKDLIQQGYKHIVLLGQNVNSYSSELPEKLFIKNSKIKNLKLDFSNLLREIDSLSGHFWISFISNHPKDFSTELIKAATELPKVCEFIHLPLQAGDDEILQKMNRKYTRQKYLKLINQIKKSFRRHKPAKLYSITSDIIVGFPSENRKQFLKSAEVMQKVGFDMVYFGQYSPRPGTTAYKLKNNIPKTEKSRREKYLNEILKKTSWENNQKYLGKTQEILIDKQEHPKVKPLNPKGLTLEKTSEENIYFGRTRTMKNVKIISDKRNLIGRIIKAKIIKASIWNLEARIK